MISRDMDNGLSEDARLIRYNRAYGPKPSLRLPNRLIEAEKRGTIAFRF